MYNSFLELVFNPMCRMSEVTRYSGMYQETVENLAEHITDVMMLSYIIATKLNEFGEDINVGVLLEKCLLHDIEEVVIGDIPRTTKYASGGIKIELDVIGRKSAQHLLNSNQYLSWVGSKQGKEGFILKLADFLVVSKKCVIEIDLRGNYSFLSVLSNIICSFPEEEDLEIDFFMCKVDSKLYLGELWCDSRTELTELYEKHKEKVAKYNLNTVRGVI